MNEIEQKIFHGSLLTDRQKKILRLRMSHKTLAEIGQEVGVTRERIRQIGETIKQKLHQNLTENELKEYAMWFVVSRKEPRREK